MKPREWLRDAAVVCCASAVGLLAAELTLRVKEGLFKPQLTSATGRPGEYWHHAPGLRLETEFPADVLFEDYPNRRPKKIEFLKGAYAFNNLGLRDEEDVDLAAPRRGRVVLCVGDSTTMGLLVPASDAYPARLEALLDARDPGRTRVLNAGVVGYNLEQTLAHAERRLAQLKPDALVLGIYMNDAAPWSRGKRALSYLQLSSRLFAGVYGALFTPKPRRYAPEELRALLAPSLDPDSTAAIMRYDAMRSDFGGFQDALRDANDTAQWRVALRAVDRLQELSAAAGIPMAAVVFPAQFQVSFGYRHPEPQKTIVEHLRGRGIPHCDMTAAFRREALTRPVYPYLTDVAHFNALGHRLTAECLAKLPLR